MCSWNAIKWGVFSLANSYHGSHGMSDSKSLWATASVVHYFCLDIFSIDVDMLRVMADCIYYLNCDSF